LTPSRLLSRSSFSVSVRILNIDAYGNLGVVYGKTGNQQGLSHQIMVLKEMNREDLAKKLERLSANP